MATKNEPKATPPRTTAHGEAWPVAVRDWLAGAKTPAERVAGTRREMERLARGIAREKEWER